MPLFVPHAVFHPKAAYASLPTALDGRAGYPTDGVSLLRGNGTSYDPWGPIFPLTPPVLNDFAWVNQTADGTSATESAGRIFVFGVNKFENHSVQILKRAIPTAPYSLMVGMHILPTGNSSVAGGNIFADAGVVLRESSTGKLITVGFRYGTTSQIQLGKWNSPTSFNSYYYSLTFGMPTPGPIFIGVHDNNTTQFFLTSPDGTNSVLGEGRGRTDFCTPDEIGFFVNPFNVNCYLNVFSWRTF